jgi:hypothetical protein
MMPLTPRKRAYTKAWKARNRETVRRQANDRLAKKRVRQASEHLRFLDALRQCHLDVVYW